MSSATITTPKDRLEHVFEETAKGNGQPFLDALAEDAEWTVIGSTGWSKTQGQGENITRDGHKYENTYCWVFAFRDGHVRAITEYADTELIRSVLGEPRFATP